MNEFLRAPRSTRIGALPWLGALGVHAGLILLLSLSGEPATSKVPPRPTLEAVRVQAIDAEQLQQKRAAYQAAKREAERLKREAQQAREEEKKRKAAAQAKRKQQEAAKRKAAEAKRKQEEAAKRKAAAEKKRRAAEAAARKAKELEEKLRQAEAAAAARRAEQQRQEQQQAALRARQADIWRIAIKSRIERFWLQPPATRRTPCEVVVEQSEKGEVLSAVVRDCRASEAWQESLRNAVLKASPLPPAPRKDLFDRTLVITFNPE